MTRSSWNRVRRDRPCPICGKPDWCMIAADRLAVICARTESDKPAGQAGWVHRIGNDWTPRQWIPVSKPKPKPAVNLDELHDRCRRSLRPDIRGWLSDELGISIESIEAFQVGYHPNKNVFSFPMRRPNDSISGIRYRTHGGGKFSETGGKEGLFFVTKQLTKDYLIIVEGSTDAMAIFDLNFRSVIGRSNCRGNVAQIQTLCRRLKPRTVVIVPDNDEPGVDGAKQLQSLLLNSQILTLPSGIKDVRQCVQDANDAGNLCKRIVESIRPTKTGI